MIDTALPDMVDELVNFEKRRKEFEVLAQIKLLQSASQIYTFSENIHFWEWFDAVRVYDENERYVPGLQIRVRIAGLWKYQARHVIFI